MALSDDILRGAHVGSSIATANNTADAAEAAQRTARAVEEQSALLRRQIQSQLSEDKARDLVFNLLKQWQSVGDQPSLTNYCAARKGLADLDSGGYTTAAFRSVSDKELIHQLRTRLSYFINNAQAESVTSFDTYLDAKAKGSIYHRYLVLQKISQLPVGIRPALKSGLVLLAVGLIAVCVFWNMWDISTIDSGKAFLLLMGFAIAIPIAYVGLSKSLANLGTVHAGADKLPQWAIDMVSGNVEPKAIAAALAQLKPHIPANGAEDALKQCEEKLAHANRQWSGFEHWTWFRP